MRRLAAPVPVAVLVTVVLGGLYAIAPHMGTDLAAQYAHARHAGYPDNTPVNLDWYGGITAYGYSLVSPALMHALGPQAIGALSAVVCAGALAYALVRTGAHRPLLGGVLIALVTIANLVSGRITFALGLAFAALALAALVAPVPRRVPRLALASALALLTSVTSPVAGLFTGLAAAALLLGDLRWDRSLPGRVRPGPRLGDALALGIGAAVGLAVMTVFSDGGAQPFDAASMRLDVGLAVVVALIVPAERRVLRIGAGLTVALLLFTFYVPTAVGANATRLPMLFAVPVVAAYATVSWQPLGAALVAMVWWQPPLVLADLSGIGAAQTRQSFFSPLNTELAALGGPAALGRVEVVPLRDHWESYYATAQATLARGWERQVDVERNPLFYTGRPIPSGTYGAWLRANAVTYVAIAPAQPLDVYARTEAAVIAGLPDYLHLVWHNDDWYLFSVDAPDPFVTGGTLDGIGTDAARVRPDGTGRPVLVKIRWSRWLTVDGGACLASTPDGWTEVRGAAGGVLTISSGLRGTSC